MKSSAKDCYEKIIDIDVKYTFRFMQCTGRCALMDDQTGALMVHMLFECLLLRPVRNNPP